MTSVQQTVYTKWTGKRSGFTIKGYIYYTEPPPPGVFRET